MPGMNKYPGEVADQIGGGLIGGLKGVVSSITGGIMSAGESVQRGLDKPADALRLKHSPFRVIDDVLDGTMMAGEGYVNRGVLDGIATACNKLTDGLDKVPDTFAGAKGGMDFPAAPWDRR